MEDGLGPFAPRHPIIHSATITAVSSSFFFVGAGFVPARNTGCLAERVGFRLRLSYAETSRSVPQAGSQFHGLATAVHETSELMVKSSQSLFVQALYSFFVFEPASLTFTKIVTMPPY
jgi:hypothetical protein